MQPITTSLCIGLLLCSTVIHAQKCENDVPKTGNDSRYEILSNGSEVRDKKTNLIWQRCSLGQKWDGNTCIGTAQDYSWDEALTIIGKLGTQYRMPNIKELQSLADYQCMQPAINSNIFPNTPAEVFWSSSAYGNPSNVWTVDFEYGETSIVQFFVSYYYKSAKARAIRSENK